MFCEQRLIRLLLKLEDKTMSRLEPTNEASAMQKEISAIAEQGGETTKVEQLIQQYCPDGVEYRPIWSLTAWDKKFNGIDKSKQKNVIKYNYLLAADLKSYQVENGTVKLLTTNISNLYTTEELAEDLASDGEVVAIPWGGNPIVQYYKGRFLTADNRIATALDTTLLNNKFLYYCMLNQMKLIASFYRGSGIKHPEMAKVLDLEIPVPPLPVQEEIVRILDNFSELQAELQAELQKRLQQYEYYRDNLLSFEGRTDVEWKKLGDVADLGTGSHNTQDGLVEGEYPFYTRGSEILYLNDYDYDETAIITAGDGAGVGKVFHFVEGKYALHQRAYRIVPNEKFMLARFVYYYIGATFYNYIMKSSVSSSVVSIRKPMMVNYPIPVPSLEEQQKIVDILDRFDKLATDITAGLPAEIEARRKQYEYYRDRLLTFKQKA